MGPRRRSDGQALTEFAIVLPVFLMLLIGGIDLARAVWASGSVDAAAREAARFAVVHGGSPSTACPVGPAGADAVIPAPSASCPNPSPSKQAIRDRAVGMALAAGSNVTVTVCYGAGCSGDSDTGVNDRGTPVTVTVTSSVPLVLPALFGTSRIAVTGRSTMLVNH